MSLLYPKWLREIITEPDNLTRDFKRVAPLCGMVSFFALSFWSVALNHSPFDAANYAQGLGYILGPSVLAVALENLGRKSDGT